MAKFDFVNLSLDDNADIRVVDANFDKIELNALTAAELNTHNTANPLDHPDNSVTDNKIGNRTITDTTAANGSEGTVTSLFSKLGYMIKAITGKTNWYTLPAISLESVNTKLTTLGDGTSANIPNTLVKRDGTGGFVAATGVFSKLGVGTTSPTAALDVEGAIRVTDTASSSFVPRFKISNSGAAVAYTKIAELVTNIGSSANGLIVYVSGTSDYGNNIPGADILQCSTRGTVNLEVYTLMPSGSANTTYAYVNNAVSGKTEIWLRQLSFTTTTEILVTKATGATYGNLLTQSSEPEGMVYVTKQIIATTNNTALTGTPTTPTATAGTNNTQIASTAFVRTAMTATNLGFTQSLAENGWTRLPNGLILQWGKGSGNNVINVTWPIAFPTACFVATAIPAQDTVNERNMHATSISTTGGIFIHTGNNAYWLAIGY